MWYKLDDSVVWIFNQSHQLHCKHPDEKFKCWELWNLKNEGKKWRGKSKSTVMQTRQQIYLWKHKGYGTLSEIKEETARKIVCSATEISTSNHYHRAKSSAVSKCSRNRSDPDYDTDKTISTLQLGESSAPCTLWITCHEADFWRNGLARVDAQLQLIDNSWLSATRTRQLLSRHCRQAKFCYARFHSQTRQFCRFEVEKRNSSDFSSTGILRCHVVVWEQRSYHTIL